MEKTIIRVSTLSGIGVSMLFGFFSLPLGVGMLLGVVSYFIYYQLLVMSIDDAIDSGNHRNLLTTVLKMVRYLLFILPLLVAFFTPNYVSFWGVFIGLIWYKIIVYIFIFLKKI